jgi:hypothetical protein
MHFYEFIEVCARTADAKDLTSLYSKVRAAYDNAASGSNTEASKAMNAYDFMKIHSSSAEEWRSRTGNMALKLPVYIYIYIYIYRHPVF